MPHMKRNLMGGVDISLPNISYCKDVKDVHYNPYNTVEFYVGEVTKPQTVSIYTDKTNHVDVEVSEGNKWYSYVLPKDNGLCKIEGNSVKNAVIKGNISYEPMYSPSNNYYYTIIPSSTIKASFKGSNTSNLTKMNWMFRNCSGLTSLDVSSFDTSKVTDMCEMFAYCSNLTSLDVSNFDTSKVTDMLKMFNSCKSLTSLTLSNFDTSKVTIMESMFNECSGLTSLDVSSFDTSNVIIMSSLFRGCSSLTSLDLSGWDTSNVTNMDRMFEGCSKLKTIRMVGCSGATRTKIQNQLTADGITGFTIVTK